MRPKAAGAVTRSNRRLPEKSKKRSAKRPDHQRAKPPVALTERPGACAEGCSEQAAAQKNDGNDRKNGRPAKPPDCMMDTPICEEWRHPGRNGWRHRLHERRRPGKRAKNLLLVASLGQPEASDGQEEEEN